MDLSFLLERNMRGYNINRRFELKTTFVVFRNTGNTRWILPRKKDVSKYGRNINGPRIESGNVRRYRVKEIKLQTDCFTGQTGNRINTE